MNGQNCDTSHPTGGPCFYLDLPITRYHDTLLLQRRIIAARHTGTIDFDSILILEHFPIFTIGRNANTDHLVVNESFLRKKDIPLVRIERGGDITYHGPGQVVGYPIIKLDRLHLAIKDYISLLEAVMIKVAADLGVKAGRNSKNRGVFVNTRKLGSIGIAVRRNIAFHGFALNVSTDLDPFDWIQPCGLVGVKMTSLEAELGSPVDSAAVRKRVRYWMASLLGLNLTPIRLSRLRRLLFGGARSRTTAGTGRN